MIGWGYLPTVQWTYPLATIEDAIMFDVRLGRRDLLRVGAIGALTLPGLLKARAEQVSTNARTGVEKWLRGMQGCTVIQGQARFEGPNRIAVGNDVLTAPRIFINVGGRAVVPDLPGVHDVPYLTNTTMLKVDRVPEHLVVVGGSYVGLEFAQMYRRFGAEVSAELPSPARVYRALDAEGDERQPEPIENVGTRHRAAYRFVNDHPGGLAVVISQDGAVSFVANREGQVVFWQQSVSP